jgi:hypothetical protein
MAGKTLQQKILIISTAKDVLKQTFQHCSLRTYWSKNGYVSGLEDDKQMVAYCDTQFFRKDTYLTENYTVHI